MEKLRILFLITDFGKGGAERFLIDFAKELKNRDDVEILIGVLFNKNDFQIETKDLPIVDLKYHTFSFFKKNEYLQYKKVLEDFDPHVIHSHRFLAEFLSSFYLNSNRLYVCHGHDNMVQFENIGFKTFFNRRKLINFLEKEYLILNKYKKIKTYFIANSSDTKEFYEKSIPVSTDREIILLQCGFNFNRFYLQRDRKIKSKVKIVNVGSFQPKKNQKFIIDIAKELNKSKINFEINLLGDGELRKSVEEQVKKNNLKGYIKFHGNVDEVEKYMFDSDLYLHTAWYEPFGLVFLEAMAAGLPIVSLDGKGNRDLIKNGENGFIIYDQDPKLFAEAIIKLINDRELYRKISKNGQLFARRFDIKIKTNEFINFYKNRIKSLG